MTMPSDAAQPPTQSYVEDGVLTVHAIPFKFINAADIVVVRTLADGTKIPLAQPADYHVAGGGYGIGSITKTNGGVAGASITIERHTSRAQLVDYLAGDDFSEESQEHALDKLTMIVQDAFRDALREDTLAAALAKVVAAGTGMQVNLVGAKFVITSTVEGVDTLADMVMLSGDQQGGGVGGTSSPQLDERIRDVIGLALQGSASISVTPNDAGDVITIALVGGIGGDNLTTENVQDIVGALITAGAGIVVNYNDAGNVESITATGLDPSYEGLVPSAINAPFAFDNSMNGRARDLVAGCTGATLQTDAVNPLAAGWSTVIRNSSGANIPLTRAAGVSLFKNGSLVSADGVLAPGAVIQIQRWGVDQFTASGNGLA